MAEAVILSTLLVLFTTLTITFGGVSDEDRKIHIVYMGALLTSEYSPLAHHQNILKQVLENSLPSESLVRSYRKSFNGFAARLTERERQKLVGMEGIVSVFPSRTIKPLTTRSWDFMGFPETVKRIPKVESDVIVGVIDTGIWPESDSFSDKGFGPPPKKWKGACNGGKNFTCNNKIIGARFYSVNGDPVSLSARDTEGHGTHTASTAAGNLVKDASFYGIGNGNARGAVPSARIAVYKACWNEGCQDADILAAFDDAISDGVDILSVSLGGAESVAYNLDTVAIGSFHAMQKGILTSQSAGNNGPFPKTVASVAPWLLSVAASSADRQIVTRVILGDGTVLLGNSINGFDAKGKKFPLILGGHAASSDCNYVGAGDCSETCLNSTLAKGKIVYCDVYSDGEEALNKSAAGMISGNDETTDDAWVYPLPTAALNALNTKRILSYIKSTKKPEASILKSESLRNHSAPIVVSFSSRGPNPITSDILKPDVTAPGVDILAAWSPVASPSNVEEDTRPVKYNMVSGTSMSCPHVTGAAAYVKSFHPDWSPSAIKSALMTTAVPLNATKNPDGEFAYGAGHINPVKAVNPGLVYEAFEDDYIKMLCSIGYIQKQIRLLTGKNSSCPKNYEGSAKDLNYPSMASDVKLANFKRTVTNVGLANSTYTAIITPHPNLKVNISPKVLSFTSLNEKKSFDVTVSAKKLDKLSSASLVWSDGIHTVRSPITVYEKIQ